MDIIGEAIASMRSGAPTSARCSLKAPWGMRFPAMGGAGFHVILQGAGWMLPPGDAQPIRLGVGDVVFVSHVRSHALVDDPATPQYLMPGATGVEEDIPEGTGPVTAMLCGSHYLDQIRPHPLIAALPEVIHLPARVAPGPAVKSIVELLGAAIARQAGYQSGFAFSKAFKREFSLSPTDYRRQHRAGARMGDA